jgi:formiminotetrahydrofolate cyclodeaminase
MIDQPFRDFVQSLAARSPTPGGGAAAASTAAMGVALLSMVLRFAQGRRGAEDDDRRIGAALQRLEACIERIMPMVERDMASFEHVASAYKLPHDNEELKVVRTRAIQEALAGAIIVPEELLHFVRDALAAGDEVVDTVGRSIVADLGAAAELLVGGARSAALLVRINAKYLHDREVARATVARAAELLGEVEGHATSLRRVVEERLS